MSRPKSSDWHPVGLEGANVDDLYTDELLNNIIERHLRVFNEEKKAELRRRLRNIAGLIKLERHYRRRPTESSKRKALNDVRKALKAAKELVGSLDSDSRRMIEAEAGRDRKLDEEFPALELEGGVTYLRGDERYQIAVERCESLLKWTEAAIESLGRSPVGRPREFAEERAAVHLRKIWTEIWQSEPSEEEFIRFMKDFVEPLSLKGSMRGHLKTALYRKESLIPIK